MCSIMHRYANCFFKEIVLLAWNFFYPICFPKSGQTNTWYVCWSITVQLRLAFLEMWYTTAAISKMLSNLISSQKTISFTGCLFQMHFFHPFGNTKGALLTVMAIDRYVAICNPLRYQMIMTPRLCAQLSAGSCSFGFLILLPQIVMIST